MSHQDILLPWAPAIANFFLVLKLSRVWPNSKSSHACSSQSEIMSIVSCFPSPVPKSYLPILWLPRIIFSNPVTSSLLGLCHIILHVFISLLSIPSPHPAVFYSHYLLNCPSPFAKYHAYLCKVGYNSLVYHSRSKTWGINETCLHICICINTCTITKIKSVS